MRLERVMQTLADEGLLARMTSLPPRPADLDLLRRVHRDSYLAALKQMAGRGGGHIDADTYVAAASYDAALLAAGGVVELVGAVLSARARTGSPWCGRRAITPTRAGMGFCLLNNVAAAAQAALTEFGLSRVLVVDWDVHHGNGTQAIFYDSAQCSSSRRTSTRITPAPGIGGRPGGTRGRGIRSTCRCRPVWAMRALRVPTMKS